MNSQLITNSLYNGNVQKNLPINIAKIKKNYYSINSNYKIVTNHYARIKPALISTYYHKYTKTPLVSLSVCVSIQSTGSMK